MNRGAVVEVLLSDRVFLTHVEAQTLYLRCAEQMKAYFELFG